MQHKNKHIIQKQTIEVQLASGRDAFMVQDKIKNIYYEKILPRLDELFSALVNDDLIVRLDTLDLHLGDIDSDKLEHQLVEKTVQAAQKYLEQKLQFDVHDHTSMELIPVQKSAIDVLLYFLAYGRFPWWSGIHDLSLLEAKIMDGQAGTGLQEKLRYLITSHPFALQRLICQFSDAFLFFLLQLYFPALNGKQLLDELLSFFSGSMHIDALWLKELFWSLAFAHLSDTAQDIQSLIVQELLHQLGSKNNITPAEFLLQVKKQPTEMYTQLHAVLVNLAPAGNNMGIVSRKNDAPHTAGHGKAVEDIAWQTEDADVQFSAKEKINATTASKLNEEEWNREDKKEMGKTGAGWHNDEINAVSNHHEDATNSDDTISRHAATGNEENDLVNVPGMEHSNTGMQSGETTNAIPSENILEKKTERLGEDLKQQEQIGKASNDLPATQKPAADETMAEANHALNVTAPAHSNEAGKELPALSSTTKPGEDKLPHSHKPALAGLTKESKGNNFIDRDEIIYLELAGLVILHPFLPEFFKALQLTKDKQFVDEAAVHKAVHLMGYLATGETALQEHLLILPKLLCGMELTTPVKKSGVLNDTETAEAEQLLQAVIAYWPALKNTSPEGLRSAFLQRAGKLSGREGGRQLDIEKKTWDILLSKLPWGLSVIKLPWMKEMLFISWG